MPTLNLALGLGMKRCASHVAHAVVRDSVGQFTCDVRRAIITEQPWLVQHSGAITAGCLESQFQGVSGILGPHGRAELPCDDVTGEVVKHRRQIHPRPTDDLEVCEVGLPHLVGTRGFGVERFVRIGPRTDGGLDPHP